MAATANPSYLKRRGHTWWMKLPVPKDLQKHYGRTHIEEALGTRDREEANRLKLSRLAHWKADFAKQRRGGVATIEPRDVHQAGALRRMVVDARTSVDPDDADLTERLVVDELERIEERHGPEIARQVADIAYLGSGKTLLEAWLAWMPTCDFTPGTQAKYRRALDDLLSFLALPDAAPGTITAERAQAYVDWLNTKATNPKGEPLDPETKQGRVAALSSFWRQYLEPRKHVPKGSNPWRGHEFTGARQKARQAHEARRAFTADEMLALINGPARGENSTYSKRTMLELYALGFYTGARLDELCARRIGEFEVIPKGYTMHIRESKSQAGVRSLPIVHRIAVAVIRQRIGKRTDPAAFLFAELIPGGADNKRSWQVQKAMGDYRRVVGLPPSVTFHSTRHSFATRMEEAGVDSRWAERYFGHTVPGLMGGRYSHADTLVKVAQAIKYPMNVEKDLRRALGMR